MIRYITIQFIIKHTQRRDRNDFERLELLRKKLVVKSYSLREDVEGHFGKNKYRDN